MAGMHEGASRIAENQFAYAIGDPDPVTPGHAIVVARRPVSDWWDATPDERRAMLDLVDVVREEIIELHEPAGFNVGFDAGESAGQTSPHLTIHVIPRYGRPPRSTTGMRAVASSGPDAAGAVELLTPNEDSFFRALGRCLADPTLDRIDLVVSFVMRSGTEVLGERIDEALDRGAHVRLLTSDYLGITDPAALGYFVDRVGERGSGGRLELRVFSDPTTSFHPKAYIFSTSSSGAGTAFVGSSNLSESGLRRGIEWNLRSADPSAMITEFETLWEDERTRALDEDWLRDYENRRVILRTARLKADAITVEDADEEPDDAPIAPWEVQRQALGALTATRAEGHRAGLVVMATGLGKTWLAAFDATRPQYRRVLFVAHREEILTQARDVFRRIRPSSRLSMFVGGLHDAEGDVVFASVQSLSSNLSAFDPAAFDYIVVDEFHHAAASTYRRVISHFTPSFMLGLTATPDRSDAADLLALCDDNLVFECGLVAGIESGLLSPFRYRAIKDVADYEHIPWRSGRFDVDELTARLETEQRAAQVFDEWSDLGGDTRRALAFCCSISHADYMADFFRGRGVDAAALHSGPGSDPRRETLDRFAAGEVPIIFTVDLFNEGLDIPTIDVVLLLRPTESRIVFFQQLGRGLRAVGGKTHLDIVDLVGNHRGFLLKAHLLAALAGASSLTSREAITFAAKPFENLPDGCSIIVDTEVVEMLRALAGTPTKADHLAEVARAWVDEHEGARPTALELTLRTSRAHELKRVGGWFGFLDGLGLLSEDERSVHEFAEGFFVEVEHGAYRKSLKLVTLDALGSLAAWFEPVPLPRVYEETRRRMFGDPRLTADMNDATSNFADPWNPTPTEWARYWRRNPIAALLGEGSRGTTPFFTTADDYLTFSIEIPVPLRATFTAMTREIVEYRLYRYLVSRDSKAADETRKPLDADSREINATFSIASTLGRPVSVLFASAGGTAGGKNLRNPEYVAGVAVVLERLRAIGATVLDAYVDSGRVQDLPIPDRRLDPGAAGPYPIALDPDADLEAFRKSLLRSMRGIGRAPGAKSAGGNNRKAMRIAIKGPQSAAAADLADFLAGTIPLEQILRSSGAVQDITA